MSSQSLRPWLAAATRCTGRTRIVTAHNISVRRFNTWEGQQTPLETTEDWTQFQLDRSRYKAIVDVFSEYGSTQTRENTFRPHHTLHRPLAPEEATISALLAAGAHFGHAKSLMNPNFTPYAYGVRAGITVIDLDTTLPLLRRAAQVVRAVAAKNGTIVFVGTRPDLRAAVRKAAERMGEQGFHVGEKWLPGTLTNKLQMFGAETVKNHRVTPDLVIFLNPIPNIHAIRECALEHVPTIGMVDSNVDPRIVMYPIPANDESTKTAELIAGILSVAGREGVILRQEQEEKKQVAQKKLQRSLERK